MTGSNLADEGGECDPALGVAAAAVPPPSSQLEGFHCTVAHASVALVPVVLVMDLAPELLATDHHDKLGLYPFVV